MVARYNTAWTSEPLAGVYALCSAPHIWTAKAPGVAGESSQPRKLDTWCVSPVRTSLESWCLVTPVLTRSDWILVGLLSANIE